jgi:uridylate kinase
LQSIKKSFQNKPQTEISILGMMQTRINAMAMI